MPSTDTVVAATVAEPPPPVTSAPPERERFQDQVLRITRGRYMEGRCRKAQYPGWEGFPLRRCRYSVPDVLGHKSTEVIMLNPRARQLARWMNNACEGRAEGCQSLLAERILLQSSAQFVVAGVVLEDMRPVDRHYEMYCFRHGVRVDVAGFPTQSTERPNQDHVRTCLDGELVSATSFARIAGTTPGEYRAHGGTAEVGADGAPTSAWLDVVRQSYQSAWHSRRNTLIDAWVAAHLE